MVYVDRLVPTVPHGNWPFKEAAHLFADSDLELHAFARGIGLSRAWFQKKRLHHYDLNGRRHAAALAAGAQLVDRHFIAQRMAAPRP